MKKFAWYFDIHNNMNIAYQELRTGQSNNGDYHHHNWEGPFDTFGEAKSAGLSELRFRVRFAQREYRAFRALRKPAIKRKANEEKQKAKN